MKCRHCGSPQCYKFLDLGSSPPSNAYLCNDSLNDPEIYYPLQIYVCNECWLVQTSDTASASELFKDDYAYFSSASSTWLEHARKYAEQVVECLKLGRDSLVIEVASNDGYLLKHFVNWQIPCLGIEPTDSTASVAESQGVKVLREFFGYQLGRKLASDSLQCDLLIGNNVLAHVPDINDFVQGIKAVLKPHGTVTLEFPHLLNMMSYCQFDTVYHEHFSYLSLHTVSRIFDSVDLRIWHVEQVETHGGSLRVYACHSSDARETTEIVGEILALEKGGGMRDIACYLDFQRRAGQIKDDLLIFLLDQKIKGRKVIAYGAAAKGNTLLNYAGVKPDLVSAVLDVADSKQGKFLPGSHIPIYAPSSLVALKPDFILILPWNLTDEVVRTCEIARTWGCHFVLAVPKLKIF